MHFPLRTEHSKCSATQILSMDTLPFELLSRIIDHLESEYPFRISPYASISIPWQTAVERRTFHTTPVKLLCKSLDQLREILLANDARRVQYVRTLSVDLGINPEPIDPNVQPSNQMATIDENRWMAAMMRLFVTVTEITEHVEHPPPLHLYFCARKYELTIDDWGSLSRGMPTTIPRLEHITSIGMDPRMAPVHIPATGMLAIVDHLPNLTDCAINFCEWFSWGRRRRTRYRRAIADSILERDLVKVQHLTLRSPYHDHSEETYDPTNATSGMDDGTESSIKILRHLTMLPQLTTLHLTGCHVISNQFFRDLPPFPVLSEFILEFSSSSAEGQWFFVEDKELMAKISELDEQRSVHFYESDSDLPDPVELWDDEDEDGPLLEKDGNPNCFRTMPNPELVPGLLRDAASMVASTSTLRKFILRHTRGRSLGQPHWRDPAFVPYGRHLEIWYLRSGTSCDHGGIVIPTDEPFVNTDRIFWRVGERWRPDADTIKAWQMSVGLDVKFCFLKDIYDTYAHSITWQSIPGCDTMQYTLDLEWEEPGQDIDLEIGKLKQPYERIQQEFGPLTEENAKVLTYSGSPTPHDSLPDEWID